MIGFCSAVGYRERMLLERNILWLEMVDVLDMY